MRSFDANAAAIALGVTPKWLDNLLSHHHVLGVIGGRQGVRRLIQPQAILRISVAIRLARELGLPTHRALCAADRLVADGCLTGELGLELRIDIASLARDLDVRLADATEAATTRKRGRPRGTTSKRADIPQLAAAP